MKIIEHDRTRHEVHLDIKPDEPQWILFLSDVHFDSEKCDRKMLKRHLDMALERNAAIHLNGDWLDLMGGKYDPRNVLPGGLRPEYLGSEYFDLVIDDAARYLKPYAHLITIYAQGNHETNVRKRQHTDPSRRLVTQLQHEGSSVRLGGYAGWVRYRFTQGGTETRSYLLHYHHGYGGNAPRSKGVLHADIDQAKFPDADIILRGHDHNKWHIPSTVIRINSRMKKEKRSVHHIRCGSYKALGDQWGGWETEKGFGEPRLGGYWWKVEKRGKTWTESIIEAV